MAKVFVSSVIPAPAVEVWAVIRDFNGLPAWTPFVAESRIEHNAAPDKVGCIRNFRLRDGGVIAEGYHAELDRLRGVRDNGRAFLADYQRRLAEDWKAAGKI